MYKNENFAVFKTTESYGLDICIKDNLERYTLIPIEDVADLIEALAGISIQGLVPVSKSFDSL